MKKLSLSRNAGVWAAVALFGASMSLASSSTAQETAMKSAPAAAGAAQLEFQMRMHSPNSAAFGQADGEYWKVITQTQDFPRAYSFFSQMSDEAKTPDSTLLAAKASAEAGYVGWLYQNHLADQAGEVTINQLLAGANAEYKQALEIDPENFSALYGFAIFEGYRPGGEAHQKELLAKLDTLRASRPYLPWNLVDQLEKSGRPE